MTHDERLARARDLLAQTREDAQTSRLAALYVQPLAALVRRLEREGGQHAADQNSARYGASF
jgi:hypothetical protein